MIFWIKESALVTFGMYWKTKLTELADHTQFIVIEASMVTPLSELLEKWDFI
jgi:hypothetical protein